MLSYESGFLISFRTVHGKLEEENTDQKKKLDSERKKAQAAAEKAREMIKVSSFLNRLNR